jgi:hypothetical protein
VQSHFGILELNVRISFDINQHKTIYPQRLLIFPKSNINTLNRKIMKRVFKQLAHETKIASQIPWSKIIVEIGRIKKKCILLSFIFFLYGPCLHSQMVQLVPINNGSVGQYEKIEFGIVLPLPVNVVGNIDLQGNIDAFFGVDNHNQVGWGHDYSVGINPYDPEQISVEATFSKAGPPDITETIYGFFYREYQVVGVPTSTASYWDQLSTTYKWRVRFAPKQTGTWAVTYKIKYNQQTVYTSPYSINFTCVTSSNKGFLKLGSNKRFFVASNGQSVFPLGLNLPWTFPPKDAQGNPIGPAADKYYPSKYYEHKTRTQDMAQYGVNYNRIFNVPEGYAIEYEKLGVYDAHPSTDFDNPNLLGVNRQAIMWQTDKYLEMAHDFNMYIQWVLDPNVSYDSVAWISNVYKTGIGLTNVEDFFTDPMAIKKYKNRLRYTIARWGYSTNIGCFEVMNEIHHFPDRFSSAQQANSNSILTNWMGIMLDYIKNPVQSGGLGHLDHSLTTSCNLSNGLFNQNPNSDIGDLLNLDFTATHPYAPYGVLNIMSANSQTAIPRYKKPSQAGELGCGLYLNSWGADDGFLDYINPSFHSILWASCFTGGPTSGIENWARGIAQDTVRVNGKDGYLQHFAPLQSFLKGETMDQQKYYPGKVIGGTGEALEAFFLLNNGSYLTAPTAISDRAIGYVHNKTYAWQNFIYPACSTYYDANIRKRYIAGVGANYNYASSNWYPDPYLTNPTCPVSGQLGSFTIPNLVPNTTFGIEWYDTYLNSSSTWAVVRTDYVQTTSQGQLVLTPPAMTGSQHDFGFKIRSYSGDACTSPHNDAVELTKSNPNTSYQELTMVERCLWTGKPAVIRTTNVSNISDTYVYNGIDYFQGWLDPTDRLFVGDMNNDAKDELILVNTSYNFGAVMAVDPRTRELRQWIDHDGTFNNWMDATDKMFLADVNYDNKADLILVNTFYNPGGAIRVIDLNTGGNLSLINHGSPSPYFGFMDAGDRMFIADIIPPNSTLKKKALVMVNTNYSSISQYGSIKVVDLLTGAVLNTIYNQLAGWLDPQDKMFIGDVDNDSDEELVMVNEGYLNGAFYAVDLNDPNGTWSRAWGNSWPWYLGMRDYNDKMLLEDVTGDGKKDLIFINNTSNPNDPDGYIGAYDIYYMANIVTVNSLPSMEFLDCADRALVGNVTGTARKDLILVNSSNPNYTDPDAFLIYDFDNVSTPVTVQANSTYGYFYSWLDGGDKHSICHTEINGSERQANTLTGIKDGVSDEIKISPNPTDGPLNVSIPEAQEYTFKIYDVSDKLLLNTKHTGSVELELGAFENGVYFLEITNTANNSITRKKLIKTN